MPFNDLLTPAEPHPIVWWCACGHNDDDHTCAVTWFTDDSAQETYPCTRVDCACQDFAVRA